MGLGPCGRRQRCLCRLETLTHRACPLLTRCRAAKALLAPQPPCRAMDSRRRLRRRYRGDGASRESCARGGFARAGKRRARTWTSQLGKTSSPGSARRRFRRTPLPRRQRAASFSRRSGLLSSPARPGGVLENQGDRLPGEVAPRRSARVPWRPTPLGEGEKEVGGGRRIAFGSGVLPLARTYIPLVAKRALIRRRFCLFVRYDSPAT